jgi:hypothetical protein
LDVRARRVRSAREEVVMVAIALALGWVRDEGEGREEQGARKDAIRCIISGGISGMKILLVYSLDVDLDVELELEAELVSPSFAFFLPLRFADG